MTKQEKEIKAGNKEREIRLLSPEGERFSPYLGDSLVATWHGFHPRKPMFDKSIYARVEEANL